MSMHAAAVGKQAHEVKCTNLEDDTVTSIQALGQGKLIVLDFWTTKCTRCPMAIMKLNRMAAEPVYKDKVVFMTVNCDDAEWAKEIAEEEEWDNLTNVFIELDVKEEIKAKWGLKTVPHYTLISPDGEILQNASADSPVKFDYEALEATAKAFDPSAAAEAAGAREERAAKMATPAKVSLEPLELSEVFTPDKTPDKADEQLSDADREELARLMKESEEMKLRIAEISAEIAEDGPDSPGFGSDPLSQSQLEEISEEPLLQENPSRFVIFPISDHDVWAMYKKAEARFWNSEEIDVATDDGDWNRLAPEEQQHLLRLMPSTCEVGQLCLDNLLNRFTQEVQSTEARMFYGNEISMLNMHNEMYASLMDVYLPGAALQAQLISDTKAKASAQKKTTWCQQWMDSKASFGLRLVAFAAVQSVMHAGTFASFYQMGERKVLSGLVHAAEHIFTDMQQYVDFGGLLFSMLTKKPSSADIERIVKDAVAIEKAFILEEFKADVLGIDASQMSQFVEHTADLLMETFKQPAIYNVGQPFGFMNRKELAMTTSGATKQAVSPTAAKVAGSAASGMAMDQVLSFGMDDDDF